MLFRIIFTASRVRAYDYHLSDQLSLLILSLCHLHFSHQTVFSSFQIFIDVFIIGSLKVGVIHGKYTCLCRVVPGEWLWLFCGLWGDGSAMKHYLIRPMGGIGYKIEKRLIYGDIWNTVCMHTCMHMLGTWCHWWLEGARTLEAVSI